jgi:hypothetical protein
VRFLLFLRNWVINAIVTCTIFAVMLTVVTYLKNSGIAITDEMAGMIMIGMASLVFTLIMRGN